MDRYKILRDVSGLCCQLEQLLLYVIKSRKLRKFPRCLTCKFIIPVNDLIKFL